MTCRWSAWYDMLVKARIAAGAATFAEKVSADCHCCESVFDDGSRRRDDGLDATAAAWSAEWSPIVLHEMRG